MPSAWCLTTLYRMSMLPSVYRRTSASSNNAFRSSIPGLRFPLSTLRSQHAHLACACPRGRERMTRGQRERPSLHCRTLSFPSSHQPSGAHGTAFICANPRDAEEPRVAESDAVPYCQSPSLSASLDHRPRCRGRGTSRAGRLGADRRPTLIVLRPSPHRLGSPGTIPGATPRTGPPTRRVRQSYPRPARARCPSDP